MSNFNISENLTQGGFLNNVEQCIAKCKEQFELILSEIKKSENIEAHKVEAFIFKELLKLGLYFLECFFAKHNQGDYGGLLKTSKGIARRGRTVEKSYFSLFGKLKVKRYLYHVGAESFAPLDILLKWAIHFAQVDESCSLWTSRDHIQSVALTIRKPCKSSMSGSLLKITVPVTSCGLDGHRLSTVPAAARKSRG